MKNLTLSIPGHTIERYLDWVEDPEKGFRFDEEIRRIIRSGFYDSISLLPKKVPDNYRYAVELKDPRDQSSFGLYHLILWGDTKRQYDLVAKSLLRPEMSFDLKFRR